jgi:hypothetical protein
MRAGMRSHPGTGWFVALVVTTLLVVGWPRVDDETRALRRSEAWPAESSGWALRAPRGWFELRASGESALWRDSTDPCGGMVSARSTLDRSVARDGFGFESLVEAFRVGSIYRATRVERFEIDGCPALRIDWDGTPFGVERPCRGIELFCDRGTARLTLCFKAGVEHWPQVEPEFEAMLASVTLDCAE